MSDETHLANQQAWQARLLAQGLSQLGQAMMIVSCRGDVVFSSKAAENILGSNKGLAIINNQLVAESAIDNDRLQQAIAGATQEYTEEATGGGVYIHRNDGSRPLYLTVTKMPKNEEEPRHGHHVLILLKDLNLNQAFWGDRLRDEYKLSPRELECVTLLSEGRDLKDVADLMNIGMETVRQYMKNIYKKMGVHKQHELVSLALEYRRNR